MAMTKYEIIVLQGTRGVMTDLCIVPLQILDILSHQINNINQVNGKKNAIKFLHKAAFVPVQDTWEKAVNLELI